MAESGVATPPEDTTTNRGTLADKHAFATLTTPGHEYKPKSLRQQEEATARTVLRLDIIGWCVFTVRSDLAGEDPENEPLPHRVEGFTTHTPRISSWCCQKE